jgi:divalent metal cation (Fe/Co/Zn/Cd) transporter
LCASFRAGAGLDNPPEIRIDIATIVILGFTIGVQFLMWIYCSIVIARGGRNVTAVEALAQDHINDVCCNSIGLMSAIVAAYTSVWFMDALGGILISIYIFARWSTVCHEQFLVRTHDVAHTRSQSQSRRGRSKSTGEESWSAWSHLRSSLFICL